MLPVDFMARVVAWPGELSPGYVNLHWFGPVDPNDPKKDRPMPGRAFKNLASFMSYLNYATSKPAFFREIYFCLSIQREHRGLSKRGKLRARRGKAFALAYKSLWVDADFGPKKHYKTLTEVIRALAKFCKDANLPPPTAIVLTGGGIHAYWISNRPLTPDEWRPLAEGLRAETIKHGFKCDDIITDQSRVLRIPGTFNNKESVPRLVKLKYLLPDDYDFTTAPFATLAAKVPPAPAPKAASVTAPVTFPVPDVFAKGPSKIFDGRVDAKDNDIGGRYDPDAMLDPTEVFRGCRHFRDSLRTHGKSQSYGLWNNTALASTWLENGREIFHALSSGYPTYTRAESDKKFDQKLVERAENKDLGWPACTTFEGEGANCRQCLFYGKLKSPLNLTKRVSTPPPPPPPLLSPEELEFPANYRLNDDGIICEIMEKEDKHGNEGAWLNPLFMCKLRNFEAQRGALRKLSFEVLLDGDDWDRVEINEGVDLNSDGSIITALRQQGVKPNTTATSARRIITFMTSFMAKLDASRKRQATVPFGWLRDKDSGETPLGFAYGGRTIMSDGSMRASGYADRQLETFYTPTGKETPWWELLRTVTSRHHTALECIIATSFAAPLAYATGLYNGVICAWSPESGAHKSTSIAVGAAVWGSPKLTKERPKSSQKGILHKLGILKNLPVYWDEINNDDKMNEVQEILSDSTEGSGGSKLKSNRQFHDHDEWQTLMLVGANKSLVENIINNNTGTDAQLQRVFEFQVEKRADTAKSYDIDRLTNALDYNYGHVGLAYSQLLGNNIKRVHKDVGDAMARFATEVNMRSEERFRCAIAFTV